MRSAKNDREFKEEIADQLPADLLDTAINWITRNLSPDEVFDEKQLDDWADDNGYVKEKKIDYEGWAKDNGYVKE
jgi:hypothetical protein